MNIQVFHGIVPARFTWSKLTLEKLEKAVIYTHIYT